MLIVRGFAAVKTRERFAVEVITVVEEEAPFRGALRRIAIFEIKRLKPNKLSRVSK